MRSRGIKWLAPSAGAVSVVALIALANPAMSTTPTPVSMPLRSSDIAKIQAAGYLLATKAQTRVQAIRAKGSDVWAEYFPDVTVGPDTDTIKSHDLIVVRSTSNVPQNLRHYSPGTSDTPTAMVSLVIDSVTGQIVETTTAPANNISTEDNSIFGPPQDVTLSSVTPPTQG